MGTATRRARYTIWPEALLATALSRHWRWAHKRGVIEHQLRLLPECQRRLTLALKDEVFEALAKQLIRKKPRVRKHHAHSRTGRRAVRTIVDQ